jgi:hypothetical protein
MLDDEGTTFMTDLGGETVTYLPSGGGSREIQALVTRHEPDELGPAPHGHGPVLTVAVINSATTGISGDEVDTGRDKIQLPVRLGETAQARRIMSVISQDAGMMQLEVR